MAEQEFEFLQAESEAQLELEAEVQFMFPLLDQDPLRQDAPQTPPQLTFSELWDKSKDFYPLAPEALDQPFFEFFLDVQYWSQRMPNSPAPWLIEMYGEEKLLFCMSLYRRLESLAKRGGRTMDEVAEEAERAREAMGPDQEEITMGQIFLTLMEALPDPPQSAKSASSDGWVLGVGIGAGVALGLMTVSSIMLRLSLSASRF